MFKTLAFSLIATVFLAGTVFAQSSNRQNGSDKRQNGSNTRSNPAAYSEKQQERENAKTILKYVGLIQRADFAGVTLDRTAKTALKMAVKENFDALNNATIQMVDVIPETSRRSFQAAFLEARESGKSAMASVKMGLASAQLPADVQQQVMTLNESRDAVMDRITSGVSQLLTAEQQQALNEAKMEDESPAETTAETTSEPAAGSSAKPTNTGSRSAGSSGR